MLAAPRPVRPSTHNAVWGRCAPDETLHLAAVSPDSVLHRLAGDNGGPCKQKTQSGSAGTRSTCPRGPVPRGSLTVHVERHLPLGHSDAGHDGPAGVGASVCLGHRLQQQLVAVTQHLGRESSLGWGARRPGPLGPGGPRIGCIGEKAGRATSEFPEGRQGQESVWSLPRSKQVGI